MRPLLPLGLALMLAGPATAAAAVSPFEHAHHVDATKANCFIPGRSVLVDEPSVNGGKKWFEFCVVPSTFVRTVSGGRAQYLVSAGFNNVTHGSYYREVDCNKMEERAQNLWSFQTDKPVPTQRYHSLYRFYEKHGIWVLTETAPWSNWKPITQVLSDHKWLCEQWRKSPTRTPSLTL